jgi:hypothetical protein
MQKQIHRAAAQLVFLLAGGLAAMPAQADTVAQCITKTAGCAANVTKGTLTALDTGAQALAFAATNPNCVTDFVEGNIVTIGVSSGMALLKATNIADTTDAYGLAARPIAGVLAKLVPIPSLKSIAESESVEYASTTLKSVASSIPVPSVAVPTAAAQIQCGQAIAQTGVKMVDDVKQTIAYAKAAVKSCGAAASCFEAVLKDIVTNPLGALSSAGQAIVQGAQEAYNAVGDFLSGQPPNIPSGEYFSKLWYQQMPYLAATYIIQGDAAGGARMASMYTQCHDYYDTHRMSSSSATETCDQIRGWQSDANQPWPHQTLNQMGQAFINKSAADLTAAAYLRASNEGKTTADKCPKGNTVCVNKVNQIYLDTAASLTPPQSATNAQKLALLWPCIAPDKQSFVIDQCVAPAFAAAKLQVDTYAKATIGWTVLFGLAEGKQALMALADLRRTNDEATYKSQCNPKGPISVGKGSACEITINKVAKAAYAAVEAVKIGDDTTCNKGTVSAPDFDLGPCLKKYWDPLLPSFQAAVDLSNKYAKDNARAQALVQLPKDAAARRIKDTQTWQPQCKGDTQCKDKIAKAFADAESQAVKAGVDACKIDDYNYYTPKCLDMPFNLASMDVQPAIDAKAMMAKADFLAMYGQAAMDTCRLRIACTRGVRELVNAWYDKVGGNAMLVVPSGSGGAMGSGGVATFSVNASTVQMKPESRNYIERIKQLLQRDAGFTKTEIDPYLNRCPAEKCKNDVMEIANAWFNTSGAVTVLSSGTFSLNSGGAANTMVTISSPADAQYKKQLDDVLKSYARLEGMQKPMGGSVSNNMGPGGVHMPSGGSISTNEKIGGGLQSNAGLAVPVAPGIAPHPPVSAPAASRIEPASAPSAGVVALPLVAGAGTRPVQTSAVPLGLGTTSPGASPATAPAPIVRMPTGSTTPVPLTVVPSTILTQPSAAAPTLSPNVSTLADAERVLRNAGCRTMTNTPVFAPAAAAPGQRPLPSMVTAGEGQFVCTSANALQACEAIKAQRNSPVKACNQH